MRVERSVDGKDLVSKVPISQHGGVGEYPLPFPQPSMDQHYKTITITKRNP